MPPPGKQPFAVTARARVCVHPRICHLLPCAYPSDVHGAPRTRLLEFFLGWRRPIHSKGARTSACSSTPIGGLRARLQVEVYKIANARACRARAGHPHPCHPPPPTHPALHPALPPTPAHPPYPHPTRPHPPRPACPALPRLAAATGADPMDGARLAKSTGEERSPGLDPVDVGIQLPGCRVKQVHRYRVSGVWRRRGTGKPPSWLPPGSTGT
jgi:hypothetical protein